MITCNNNPYAELFVNKIREQNTNWDSLSLKQKNKYYNELIDIETKMIYYTKTNGKKTEKYEKQTEIEQYSI
jgi:hypothetical protein